MCSSYATEFERVEHDDDADWLAYVESQLRDVDEVDHAADQSVVDRLSALDRAITGVLVAVRRDATGAAPGDVVEWLTALEAARRRLPAADHVLIATVEDRGIHSDYCQASPASLLVDQLNLRPSEARDRVRAAQVLGPRRSITGEPLAPRYETLAAAGEDGIASADHVRIVDRAMRQLPAGTDPAVIRQAEQTLAHHCRVLDPGALAHVAQRTVDLIDPDGREPVDHRAERLRDVRFGSRDDGSGVVHGELTPECLAVWQTILGTLARPVAAADGLRDTRTPGQRNHDALLDAGRRLLREGDLPASGGVPATVIVTVAADELARRTGYARTAHGDQWPLKDMLAAIGDAAEWVTVFGTRTDGIIGYGTDRRFASPGQTKALIARDHGCSFPGCSIPAAWCERHHIDPVVPRRPGDAPGETSLNNLTLLCGFHHRTFESAGWSCRIIDGHPHWVPPAWIDRRRTPRRNPRWTVDASP